jgi:hypothetical protein
LAGLEGKLQDALDRRDKIVDISKANAASVRDQRARLELPGLNKQAKAIDEEIALLRINITHARRGRELQEAHAAAAKRASSDAANVRRDKLFEIVCPDGRKVRHRGASQEDVRRRLQNGYTVAGQVFGADDAGNGGFIPRPGFLTAMLEAYEGEFVAWLTAHSITGNAVKVILPSNGRD